MGKATIISEVGSGRYTVQVNHDLTRTQAMLTRLNAMVSAVDARIADETDTDALARLNARKSALEKQLGRVQAAANMDYQTSAWCADLSTGLTGSVGTIEPAAEMRNGINIRPGFAGDSAHSPTRDGQATPMLSLPVADAMRNLAIMPAIQKWRPTYRYGTVSNLNRTADTCTVTLDHTLSVVQDLDVNRLSVLHNVSIEYMSCNAGAFENGDEVIVEWRPYDDEGETKGQPYVIGFKDNPKPCGWALKIQSINGIDFTLHTSNAYYLRLIQPIPTTVTSYYKGTYTEDFKVIADEVAADSVGFADFEIDAEDIDYNYPVYAQIRNPDLWMYWTSDWRGDVPDMGVKFPYNCTWDNSPSGDLEEYDYLLDSIIWATIDLDLRSASQSILTDEDSNQYSGFYLNPTGLQILVETYESWNGNNISCDWCTGSYPLANETEEDDAILEYVDTNKKPDGSSQDSNVIEAPYGQTGLSCACSQAQRYCEAAEQNGLAYKRIFYSGYVDPGSGSAGRQEWQLAEGTPGIMSDRLGQNIQFTTTRRWIAATWDYGYSYIFVNDVGVWPDICTGGQLVDGSVVNDAYTWTYGKDLNWIAVDLDADYI